MSCDIGEVTEKLENEQSSFSNLFITSPTSQSILQPFHGFTYVTWRAARGGKPYARPPLPPLRKAPLLTLQETEWT